MSDIVNPFIAGNPVTGPEMFFDREDVFEFIRRTLIGKHRDNVIVLYGQRRTGKTSVLYQMRSRLDARYLCIFMDLHGFALEGLDGFLWELANHIIRVLRRDYQINLPRPSRVEFMAEPRSFFENEFLNQVWSAIGDRHILLMLDEAIRLQEQVRAGKLETEIFEYLRHLMQHYEQLNFLFSLGSGLEEMEKEYAFLFNVGLYKKISFLDRNATSDLITQPSKDYYQVEPDAVERIYHLTSGHPYYTQLVCHCLFNYWGQQQMARIGVRDVDEVLSEAVERGSAVLKHIWEESTPAEKAILASMATALSQDHDLIDANAINRVWARDGVVLPKGEMAKAIRSLIARDVIVGQDKYTFTVDLMRLWVQKHRRLEWVKEEIADAIREWSSEFAPAVRNAYNRPLQTLLPLSRGRFPVWITALMVVLAFLLIGGSSLIYYTAVLRPFQQQAQSIATAAAQHAQDATFIAKIIQTQTYRFPFVGSDLDISTFDPALATDLYSQQAISMVFVGLVKLDDHSQIQPELAQSWEQSSDGLQWTFHLWPHLTFSDGTPLTSKDVAYSIDRALQPATKSYISLYYLNLIQDADKLNAGKIKTIIGDSILTPDANTVILRTNRKAVYFLSTLTYPTGYVVEKRLVDKYGANFTDHLTEGGGAGPFIVTQYVHKKEIDFGPNLLYHGSEPLLKRIVFPFFPTRDESYRAYQNGNLDFTEIPRDRLKEAMQMKNEYHQLPILATWYLAMNFLAKPFDNLRIRQAFALSINRETVNQEICQGTCIPTYHIIPQGMVGYNSNLTGPFGIKDSRGNPDVARRLFQQGLREEGWSDISQMPVIKFTYGKGGGPTFDKEVTLLIQMWQNVLGVNITPDPINANDLQSKLEATKHNPNGLQIWYYGWIADYPDPQDWTTLLFDKDAVGNSMNYGQNNTADALQEQTVQAQLERADTESNPMTRMQLYDNAEQQLVNAVAWIPLYQDTDPILVKPYVHGYVLKPLTILSPDDWVNIYTGP